MAFEVTEVPIIAKRTLNESSIVLTINTEAKFIQIDCIVEDLYSTGKIFRHRFPIMLRDEKNGDASYTNALNAILPKGATRTAFITNVLTVLKDEIVK